MLSTSSSLFTNLNSPNILNTFLIITCGYLETIFLANSCAMLADEEILSLSKSKYKFISSFKQSCLWISDSNWLLNFTSSIPLISVASSLRILFPIHLSKLRSISFINKVVLVVPFILLITRIWFSSLIPVE